MMSDIPDSAEERRALDQSEQELVKQARDPVLQGLSGADLSDLISRLRDRRDRARTIAHQQTRDGKGRAGTDLKAEFLDQALQRAAAERDARTASPEARTQAEIVSAAMQIKQAQETRSAMTETGGALHPHDPDAGNGKRGMVETQRRGPHTGAFDHAGHRPAMMRSGPR